jgi:hypothetical protein
MNTLDLLNQHIPCWSVAHTWAGADVFHPGCTCGWSGVPCASDNEVLDQHQAHLAREIDRSEAAHLDATNHRGHIDGIDAIDVSHLKVERTSIGQPCGPFSVSDPGPRLIVEADGDLGRDLLDLAFAALNDQSLGSDDSSDPAHDDSSTGDGPAATGSTDSVEVTARRGDDSGPGELGDLAKAWRDVVTDYAAGRLQITVSSIDADTHWCRLHRLMQAHTKEAES